MRTNKVLALGLFLAAVTTFAGGCTIKSVNQPSQAVTGDRISVQVNVEVSESETSYRGVVGVRVPPGWNVTGATFSGAFSGTLVSDPDVVALLEDRELPAKPGYTWWGGATERFFTVSSKSQAVATVNVTVGSTPGEYFLDYVVGGKDSSNFISLTDDVIDVPISVRAAAPTPMPSVTAPPLSSPAHGTRLTALGTTLTWQNPSGTTQYHLELRPYNDDGPGIILIRNAETSFTIQSPVLGTGNYVMLPDMTYTWRVRTTRKSSFAPLDDPSWGPWSEARTCRTPAPSSATITSVSPGDRATVASTAPQTLGWKNTATDIFYYEIQVSGDPSFNTDPTTATSFVWQNLVHGGVPNPPNSYVTPELPPNSAIYWRVRPRVQGDGAPVDWSKTWSFKTP
ncbi:MAG: hypothetical protein HW403_268 [Dehalococcoidia bacterium]|nr:hypothetical protein [Dehalococcoidia bacterium]